MQNLTRAVAALMLCCCVSCSTDKVSFSIPEIPPGERQPLIEKQLNLARANAVQHPDDAVALGRYAMILQSYELHEPAGKLYARARQLAPDEFRWAYLHGFTLNVLGNATQARDALAAAAELNPAAGSTRLGAVLLELGETAAARETLTSALSYDDSNPWTLFELGRLESTEGNWELAQDYLLRSIAAGATNASVYYALAEAYSRQGNDRKADEYREQFTQATDRSKSWPDPWLAQMSSMSLSDRRLMDAAVRAIQKGDIRRAVTLNEQARELNPDNPLPPAALVGLYAIIGENDKSDEILAIARQLDPDSAQLHYNIGLARMAQNKPVEAIQSMVRVTEIDPGGSLAWNKLAGLYAHVGNRDKAIEAFEQAYERTPSDTEVRLKLGVMYVDTKRYESGLALLDAPTTSDQTEAQRLWAVGRAHRNLGNAGQATAALTEAQAAALRAADGRLRAAITAELEQLNAATAN